MTDRQEIIEAELKANGVISHNSVLRRKVLGCISCKLRAASAAGEPPRIYGYGVARCVGVRVDDTLDALKQAGAIVDDFDLDTHKKGPFRKYLAPTDSSIGRLLIDQSLLAEPCLSGRDNLDENGMSRTP